MSYFTALSSVAVAFRFVSRLHHAISLAEEALFIADQVAVVRDGRFTEVDTPQEVYLTPEDRFTAEFLGDCVLDRLPVRDGATDRAGTREQVS
jgi:ABC-type Fe3+/spermidine/putrescine transport system ATPase subunit